MQSFIATYINHPAIRREVKYLLLKSNLLNATYLSLLKEISNPSLIDKNKNYLINSLEERNLIEMIKESLKSGVYQLFPQLS